MARTSLTHPLQIACVRPRPDSGRIGITFCPGKVQADGVTGPWARDLEADLEAIQAWGPRVVLTLLENHELVALGVEALGAEVERRGMVWLHLPIADYSTPDPAFEAGWAAASLRLVLEYGNDVTVHCKGGLGRAGMIAARLMIEWARRPRARSERCDLFGPAPSKHGAGTLCPLVRMR